MMSATRQESRRNSLLKMAGVAIVFSILTFAVTWAVTASRPVHLVLDSGTAGLVTASATPTSTVAVNPGTSGQSALTETELRSAVKTVGGSVYWVGSVSGALYTFNHSVAGQNFVRYLPSGKGLADVQQRYRVIATYPDAKAYQTMKEAGKLPTGVGITNPDGSLIYYAKATPTHVYLAYKNLAFQIEIFDPTPGVALKLATTPGLIKKIV